LWFLNNEINILISFQSQTTEMQLISVSRDLKTNQEIMLRSEKQFHEKLKDIEHDLGKLSKSQERGAQELSDFFAVYDKSSLKASPCEVKDASDAYSCSTLNESTSGSSKTHLPTRISADSAVNKGFDVAAVSTSIYHFTFEQKVITCDRHCHCVCHTKNWGYNAHFGTSTLFKFIFGSILFGYSNSPTPKVACDTKMCSRSSQGCLATVRYSFPSWFMNRAVYCILSSKPIHHSNIILWTARRIPYQPDNIFSKINSRDFNGAMELIQNGTAFINDTETRHGFSVLGAALRNPSPGPDLVYFIEFLMKRQINPYLENDEGESAWHYAARLMLPNTPKCVASPYLQSQLQRLFPNPDWDIFRFSHVHKVVAGLRPVDVVKELQNPKYLAQINSQDALGQTPLSLAASLGQPGAVEALLLAGANVDFYDKSNNALHPLRKAIRAQNVRCVELLLMATANPFSLDSRGASLLHTAASKCDDLAIICPLLVAGLPIDGQNAHNCTPLSFTPLKDNINVARYLLSQGADINNIDNDGDTPLTESIRLNAHRCLDLFLSRGANYQTINNRGRTILHFAAIRADIYTLKILLS
jgi:hypothetical protein